MTEPEIAEVLRNPGAMYRIEQETAELLFRRLETTTLQDPEAQAYIAVLLMGQMALREQVMELKAEVARLKQGPEETDG